MENQGLMTETEVSRNPQQLYLVWASINPQKDVGRYLYGSRNLTKMILFLEQSNFGKDNLDYFMSLPQGRQEEELYPEYRIRRTFCQQLVKFLTTVRKGIFLNAIKKLKVNEKEK
jgi:hypothetical protein